MSAYFKYRLRGSKVAITRISDTDGTAGRLIDRPDSQYIGYYWGPGLCTFVRMKEI
jgi:hypothetical protein